MEGPRQGHPRFEPLKKGPYDTTMGMGIGGIITAVIDGERQSVTAETNGLYGVKAQTPAGTRYVVVNAIIDFRPKGPK
ncbi:hypothetical protein A2841_02855 [Candidatus Kaiserbacteria bacterium RIFCSPHIGHO2_01_FULL_48_10]|uniref:Uncharacterized protein n=1 Tax=Candidatus Kaiserbacteria bacterium RIFCSPHIGHO2_01_FULL_48_10 TaxID=1798476 RepID=A0A1F6C5A2_9BACT|nr:MAG: hypothetical protein A2841_02855 [Candidatus Kaiserbacteria bacterium RIFCSPHIGHO2_01_FULL_48_10]